MSFKKHTFRGWLMQLIFRLIVLGALLYGIALGVLCLAETHPPKITGGSDAIIVLGAQVYGDGTLSPQLEKRMEVALEAYQAQPQLIITCGAQGMGEPSPEGQVMKDWLVLHGVPQSQVIAEETSRNTQQNIENAARLLPEGTQKATIITSDYHLPRALQIARDQGLQCDGIGSPCRPEIQFWVKNHFREVLAWGKYFAVKWGFLK
ncbi:MAG: YdcF family protein [Clostridia bacterium]|nr:YdcF family protein [Clostridia bacterium]